MEFDIRRLSELKQHEVIFWDRLVEEDPDLRRAFLSRPFAEAVAAGGADVRVLAGYRNGTPCALLPVQRVSGWLGRFGIFEPVGGNLADYFGALAETGVQFDIPLQLARTAGGVHAILFSHLDETQARFGLHGENPRTGLRTVLTSPPLPHWESLRKTDKKLTYDTERREKKLTSEHGPLFFEFHSSQPLADLDQLVALKNEQYERTGKSGPLHAANVDILRRLLANKHPQCQGILSTLRCGERLVAAHLGLRCHDVLHIWFPVYDPYFSSFSPGRILFRYLFDAAAQDGVRMADRGEGDNQAKRDFANEAHQYFLGLWPAASFRGKLARFAVSVYWRMSART